MPVEIEDLTFLFRRESLDRCWPGGSAGFLASPKDGTCWEDGLLVAYGPRHGEAARELLRAAGAAGLVFDRGGEFVDVAAVSEAEGPLAWCRWLELAGLERAPGEPILAARAAGDARTVVAARAGRPSVRRRRVARLAPADRPLRYLGREGQVAVYLDRFTGEELRLTHPAPRTRVVVVGGGGSQALDVEVVTRGPLSSLGLMFRESLGPDEGMLFRLGRNDYGGFWMKNTLIPLDMLFLDREGRVVELVERARPMCLEVCGGQRPFVDVLEVNGGWARARGVRPGDRVRQLGEGGWG